MSVNILQASNTLKIISDPTRLKILNVLAEQNDEMCVYEIAEAIGMTHSATSHQLSKLEDRGIVESTRDGKNMCYCLTKNSLTNKIIYIINQFS